MDWEWAGKCKRANKWEMTRRRRQAGVVESAFGQQCGGLQNLNVVVATAVAMTAVSVSWWWMRPAATINQDIRFLRQCDSPVVFVCLSACALFVLMLAPNKCAKTKQSKANRHTPLQRWWDGALRAAALQWHCLRLCPNTNSTNSRQRTGHHWSLMLCCPFFRSTVLLQQWCTDCLSVLFINIWPWFMQLLKFILLPAMFVRVCVCAFVWSERVARAALNSNWTPLGLCPCESLFPF